MAPAQGLAGACNFLRTQGRAMGGRRALLGGCAKTNNGFAGDHAWPV